MAEADTQLRVIPFQITDAEYSVMIVLQDGNIERMRAYDPVEIPLKELGQDYVGLLLKDVIIAYATDDDIREMERLARQGEIGDALRYVTRGFRFRPDIGDHDEPPRRLIPW